MYNILNKSKLVVYILMFKKTVKMISECVIKIVEVTEIYVHSILWL